MKLVYVGRGEPSLLVRTVFWLNHTLFKIKCVKLLPMSFYSTFSKLVGTYIFSFIAFLSYLLYCKHKLLPMNNESSASILSHGGFRIAVV